MWQHYRFRCQFQGFSGYFFGTDAYGFDRSELPAMNLNSAIGMNREIHKPRENKEPKRCFAMPNPFTHRVKSECLRNPCRFAYFAYFAVSIAEFRLNLPALWATASGESAFVYSQRFASHFRACPISSMNPIASSPLLSPPFRMDERVVPQSRGREREKRSITGGLYPNSKVAASVPACRRTGLPSPVEIIVIRPIRL